MNPDQVHQYFIVTQVNLSDTILAALAGNRDFDRGIQMIAEWLIEAGRRGPDKAFLCLDCDTTFGEGQEPEGFLITLPVFAGEYGTVTGICPACLADDDLDYRILRRLRIIWPDAQPLSKGTA